MCKRSMWLSESGEREPNGMMMNEEEGLEYEVFLDGTRLEHASKFKYLMCF